MPYISADDYKMVQHILAPSGDLSVLEQQIYSLNRQIRARPEDGPTPSFRALLTSHERLLAAYRAAGGNRL
jgi:hypothetical protein